MGPLLDVAKRNPQESATTCGQALKKRAPEPTLEMEPCMTHLPRYSVQSNEGRKRAHGGYSNT